MPNPPSHLLADERDGIAAVSGARQKLGRWGETVAKARLERLGYSIAEVNYRTREGEIDIVAERGGVIVFVEVRTRSGSSMGLPEESVTPSKRSHIIAAAQAYLQAHDMQDRQWRVDLAAVQLDRRGLARIRIIENAVEL